MQNRKKQLKWLIILIALVIFCQLFFRYQLIYVTISVLQALIPNKPAPHLTAISAYMAATGFYSFCLLAYLASSIALLWRRLKYRNKLFNLPYWGEILMHAATMLLLYKVNSEFLLNDISFKNPAYQHNIEQLIAFEVWAYMGAGFLAVGWISIVMVVFYGSKKEQSDVEIRLISSTFTNWKDRFHK